MAGLLHTGDWGMSLIEPKAKGLNKEQADTTSVIKKKYTTILAAPGDLTLMSYTSLYPL